MKRITLLILSLLLLFFSGCPMPVVKGTQAQSDPAARVWTIMIYMAADNELEVEAIANFNELEALDLNGAPISIIVLLDRSPQHDTTNGNWTDTRVFEIKSDPAGLTPIMKSPRLDVPEMGLSLNSETNLNTADWRVLSNFINFGKRAYPAENYALFMWGHGVGWRGLAVDDSSMQYMSLPSFRQAISGKGLSLIGFDTCFGAVLEAAYEIRGEAEVFVGSQGAIMAAGWDYHTLFTNFLQKPVLGAWDLAASIQYQFSKRYSQVASATISQIKLSEISNLFNKFNAFAGTVAEAIETNVSRQLVLEHILLNVEKHNSTYVFSDMYIDIQDFSNKIAAIRTGITDVAVKQNAIETAAGNLNTALNAAIPFSWARNGTTNKIGVHLTPMQGSVPSSPHAQGYTRGNMFLGQSMFVENAVNWAPNTIPQNNSFLDKLFYWAF